MVSHAFLTKAVGLGCDRSPLHGLKRLFCAHEPSNTRHGWSLAQGQGPDLDHSANNITLGESGQVFSSYYKDQFDAWYTGHSFPMPFSDTAVEQATVHRLVLVPAKKSGGWGAAGERSTLHKTRKPGLCLQLVPVGCMVSVRTGVDNGNWSVRSPLSSCLPFLHRIDRHAVRSWLASPTLRDKT